MSKTLNTFVPMSTHIITIIGNKTNVTNLTLRRSYSQSVIISTTLVLVPIRNPLNPNAAISRSFHRIQFHRPYCRLGQNVAISSSGGKTNASVDVLTAPTSEMNAPRLGMMAARVNVTRTRATRRAYSA